MNKKTIITAMLALVWVAGQAQNFNWRLEGKVDNATPNDTLTATEDLGGGFSLLRNHVPSPRWHPQRR